jgi:GT2 family glycosyltransferase
MSKVQRGIAVVHYNRLKRLPEVLAAVEKTAPRSAKLVLCDDGSDPGVDALLPDRWVLIKGRNLGVAANKNRALWGLQDCHLMAILEDDLVPTEKGWFETYEKAAKFSGIHHFCRVQDKEVLETIPEFSRDMAKAGLTPVYGGFPRGDFTFITSTVLSKVGGLNPKFRGVGHAHGEWSDRIVKAGLVPHPAKWIDIQEGRDLLVQLGDQEDGRWSRPQADIQREAKRNLALRTRLNKADYIHCPLELE